MQAPKILITGGAGYIGSHTVRLVAEMGQEVIVLDNLSQGHRDAVFSQEVELVVGDVGDETVVDTIFAQHSIGAVMHFAAHALVGESVTEPLQYYQNNLAAPLVLLEAMRIHGCRKFILSSTCATYGIPDVLPITEAHQQRPVNPYGWSKLMLEQVLADCGEAWGLRSVALRYFNACGASADGRLGEDHMPESHLIPRILMAVTGEIGPLTVYGNDYPTPDGTCIRDYIHVVDLADAHVLALGRLGAGGQSLRCNLGTGQGYSVKEIIALAEEVTGKKVPVSYGPRREGDPAALVADPAQAEKELGWRAAYPDPKTMIEAAWRWLTGPGKGRYRA